ncbi:hypothetical protein HN681_00490 [archaeon]|jgi:hypothetical protein|nr:hypothetical protein [archaeon]MBT3730737.1 hypothetical protein [archaeon]MBT4669639.1 hypothetical protein [archaeon]MBT5030396.1 hypothetical protein [archaeon]MBT5288311.1 hypothetical protein [archaeon]
MTVLNTSLKFIISIVFDLVDLTLGRIPVFGTAFDVVGGLLGIWLWGTPGALQFLEIIDFTDQIDSFIPTLTIAGLISIIMDRD